MRTGLIAPDNPNEVFLVCKMSAYFWRGVDSECLQVFYFFFGPIDSLTHTVFSDACMSG